MEHRRQWIARTLHGWRTEAGLELEVAAGRLGWPGAKLRQYETAAVAAGPFEIIALAAVLEVGDDERDRTIHLAYAAEQDGDLG